jgi:hypothetical protein
MTATQWFGFVILPLALTALAYAGSLVFERLNPKPEGSGQKADAPASAQASQAGSARLVGLPLD